MKALAVTFPNFRPVVLATGLVLSIALAGCDRQPEDARPNPVPTVTPGEEPTQSIIRDGFDEPEELTPLVTLESRIGFPDGGAELDEAAEEALRAVLESEQMAEGWPVVLRAHSDAGGNDAANMRATEQRGQAVAEWFSENGIDESRITIIAFGEQNPVEPNANPDGTPNEAGRAANRRVEITVQSPDIEPSDDAEPIAAETPEAGE